MLNDSGCTNKVAVDPEILGLQLWEEVQRLFVDWSNAARMSDIERAACIEQEFRYFALAFASLIVDGGAVTIGRKAILRSIYMRLGTTDTINVVTMLKAVIRREEAATRRGG